MNPNLLFLTWGGIIISSCLFHDLEQEVPVLELEWAQSHGNKWATNEQVLGLAVIQNYRLLGKSMPGGHGESTALYQPALDAFHRPTAFVGPSRDGTQGGGCLAPAYGNKWLRSFSFWNGQSVWQVSFQEEGRVAGRGGQTKTLTTVPGVGNFLAVISFEDFKVLSFHTSQGLGLLMRNLILFGYIFFCLWVNISP